MVLGKAIQYIEDHKDMVNPKYRQKYHLMPPIGWMNDPNGFIAIQDELHLFYQFHPYSSQWGPMHWGHGISQDGVVWKDAPIGIGPDKEYDELGCFSGTSLLDQGELVLMYTGAKKDKVTGKMKQIQCIATSTDYTHFEKHKANPVIAEKEIPEFIDIHEFRDPKIIKRCGKYYCIIATKTKEKTGQLVLFESEDKVKWEYKSILLTGSKEFGVMWECPDYFELDGYDVLLLSPIQMPERNEKFKNLSSCIYFIGKMDWEAGQYTVISYDEVDQGLDFYAPQATLYKGQRLMVAWMQMWDRNIPTDELGHKWAGCMTFPRILSINQDKKLIQKPLDSIYHYVGKKTNIVKNIVDCKINMKVQQAYILEISFVPTSDLYICFENNENEKMVVSYDAKTRAVTFSRAGLKHKIKGKENHQVDSRKYVINNQDQRDIKLEIFVDASSLELFINDGEGVMSSRYFSQKELNIVSIEENKKGSIKSAYHKELCF